MRRWSTQIRITLIAIATIAGAGMTFLAFRRWTTFHNETFDLAFYARMAWGLPRADIWNPLVHASIFGLHLSWILLPLGIVGLVAGAVPTLLVAQGACVASAAWPLAKLGHRHFGGPGALTAALLFFLYPNLAHVAAFEFHPGTVATLPLAWLAYGMSTGEHRTIAWSSIGTLACREDLALVVLAALAVCYWRFPGLRDRVRRLAYWCLGYFLLFVFVLMPLLAPERGSLQLHFGKFGDSPGGIVGWTLMHPFEMAAYLTREHRVTYPLKVLLPLAALPALRPVWLLPALPVLAVNLLSDFPGTTALESHYLTPRVALPRCRRA